jgi:hypothetical protein
MGPLIVVLGAVVAVAAAVRSTWSPCGRSMLSTITPFGERSRGYRYWATAVWFVVGAVVGGASLGGVAAGLAVVARAAGLAAHPGWTVSLVALAALAAAGVDASVFGEVIPIWRRQVDDGWLARYRRWVYAAGFGWQIGVGLATYIMTAAVFLVIVLAAVGANPVTAVVICTGFGLVRGLAVTLTARAESPVQLRELHRRIDRAGPAVRTAVIVVELAVSVAVVAAQWPLPGAAMGLLVVVTTAVAVAAGWVSGHHPSRAGARRTG